MILFQLKIHTINAENTGEVNNHFPLQRWNGIKRFRTTNYIYDIFRTDLEHFFCHFIEIFWFILKSKMSKSIQMPF